MDYLKVVGHDSLVRDVSTGAIINTSQTEYQEYMERRRIAEDRNRQISQHEEDINNIKNDLKEIKSLIIEFMNKKD
jgi:hypothetical protein